MGGPDAASRSSHGVRRVTCGAGRRLECVPNVSEGRNASLIGRLAEVIRAEGAELVDVHSDVDHHRSVFTCFGVVPVLERAMLALARAAVELIDLRAHQGVHPRVGALDVVPFVPLWGASMADAVEVARRVGRSMAQELALPVYFYGAAALREERRELAAIRLGGFEHLGERIGLADELPDAGPSVLHPTAGATIVGARDPLIAFNAMLDTVDVEVARRIARAIRESSGGLVAVRALGLWLPSRGRAQVSMNLLDYRRTPPRLVAERIQTCARDADTKVSEYELVGCAPADALADWPSTLAPIGGLKPSQILDPSLFSAT
ncbi:MAG: glutamate formimidoyltransferase [Candidatus Rokuibacteriota bacterium]